eukprot:Hpha_TRINITY_DN15207_c2_g5::TRINITY_DN15207_c2_g5_i2::g.67024::m.67024/K10745/RNASEH2C; ribonuclease H2 subunit C
MSAEGRINLPEGEVDTLAAQEVHLLPCSIAHEGSTDVKSYFLCSDGATEGERVSTLRGRHLRGAEIAVPSTHDIFIVRKDVSGGEWGDARRVAGVTHWAHDTDPFQQAAGMRKLFNEFPSVASALASPVTAEEMAVMMTGSTGVPAP